MPGRGFERFLGEGDFCRAYRVGALILRRAKHPQAARALQAERELLPLIRTSFAIPVPVEFGEDWMSHRPVEGEPLSLELWESWPDQSQERFLGDVRQFLRELWATPAPPQLPLYPLPCLRGLPEPWVEIFGQLFVKVSGPLVEDPVLVHGDLSPDHLLCGPAGRLAGVIDFGDAGRAEPAFDLRFLYEDMGREFFDRLMSGLPAGWRHRAALYSVQDSLEWLAGHPDSDEIEATLKQLAWQLADLTGLPQRPLQLDFAQGKRQGRAEPGSVF